MAHMMQSGTDYDSVHNGMRVKRHPRRGKKPAGLFAERAPKGKPPANTGGHRLSVQGAVEPALVCVVLEESLR